jgi:hypothetical protein
MGLEMIDDIVGFPIGDFVGKDFVLVSVAVDFKPGSISKDRAYRSFQQDVIDTLFALLGLYRLTYALKINHFLELLLEYRRGWQVEQNDEKGENAVDRNKNDKR